MRQNGPVIGEVDRVSTAEPTGTTGAPSTVQRSRSRHHPLLGGLLVKEGLINEAQLDRVLTLQQELEPRPLLGQLLLDEKLVTPHELNALLGRYQRTHLLGDVLVETKAISPIQLETGLSVHRRTDRPIGEILIELRFITERQLKEALGTQLRIPFVDLDKRSLDPSLALVISERYARHHRALPIAEIDDRIVLAMDDPTDVEVTAELRSCTGRRIDVVAATADALERAYSRVYGERGDERSVAPSRGEDEAAAPTSPVAVAPEPDASAAAATTYRPDQPARPEATLDAVRRRTGAFRQLVRSWERGIEAVEALLRESGERRAEVERLTDELRQSRSLLAQATAELGAKAQALTRLELAHAALGDEHEVLRRRLAELGERHDALLRDRQFAIDRISAALRRLRT